MAKGHTRWRNKSIEVSVYVGDGRYDRKTVAWQGTKAATQKAADRLLRTMLDDVDEGKTAAGPDITIAELVRRWRRHAEPDWSPSTIDAYDSYLRIHILPALGDKKVRDIDVDVLEDFYADLRPKLAPASIGKVHVILSGMFSLAVRRRIVRHNPVADADPPTVVRTELAPPNPADVAQLLALVVDTNIDFWTYIVVTADLGNRRGEQVGLRWNKVFLDDGEVIIDRAVVLGGGKVHEKDTKSHQARRVALGDVAATVLREHRVRCAERAIAQGVHLRPDGYVFSRDADGLRPWRPDRATRTWGRLRERACTCRDEQGRRLAEPCDVLEHARFRKIRLHDLRHAVATNWLADGVDPRTVMGRLGHASLQTLTRYTHFKPAADKEAAKRMGNRHLTG